MELLEIKNLYKNYGEKQVLNNITLTVPRGKIIGLLGKNGTGKTTLIKLINGLLTPTEGEIIFEGEKIGPQSKLNIAYLPERTYLDENQKIIKMSKGMQEKVQLVLVMSRKADLYILDEPLGGVDPATRDYILDTILTNFNEGASIIISTHLISDIERILDEVIFIDKGEIKLISDADELRNKENASIDEIFRRMFKC